MAVADGPITVTARTGEKIQIWYGSHFETTGNSSSFWVDGVHIVVDKAIPGSTRVVVINECKPSNPYDFRYEKIIYNCAYGDSGTWVGLNTCSVTNAENTYIGSGDALTVFELNHGGNADCSQQVAVSPSKDQWLVDPVSGDHNFNFKFPKQY